MLEPRFRVGQVGKTTLQRDTGTAEATEETATDELRAEAAKPANKRRSKRVAKSEPASPVVAADS